MPRTSRRPLLLFLAAAALLLAMAFLARPVVHVVRSLVRDEEYVSELPPGHVDDASRLNRTQVAEVWDVPIDAEEPERQLAGLLARAKAEGRRVSIAGARHSMGGHTIYPSGININMLPLNRMEFDEQREILKVGSGALWKDIIPYLDARGRSVAVMQSNNAFSVGGSLSVNCHGWQFDRPPIASTVESFRLMQADGTVVRCSREENQELFSLVLGGYGLFGIILDADLRVVPNERYRLEQFVVPVDRSLATFDAEIKDQPDMRMVYARMNIVPDRMFQDVIINAFFREPGGEIPPLEQAGMADLRRAIFRGSADSDYGKELRWSAETRLQPLLAGKAFSRNQLLNEGTEIFQNRTDSTTDILHEYFLPRDRASGFVRKMREILSERKANLLNVTVREVNTDPDTFLRYADQPMLAFVMLY
ncbi:MAG TPA: FAD-binding oxidoreductase, partial [Pirellulaceae bacterium]|nr:FAD-binding oxidoreductase [Pirellulaceae bacterium]